MKVLYIDFKCTTEQLLELLKNNQECEFIHYKHEKKLNVKDNLITEARKNRNSYELLLVLANNGFYLYMTREESVSSFVQHQKLPILWKKIVNKEAFYNENGIVYSFDTVPNRHNKLLVIFSSINAPIYQASLNRHFTRNFKKITKYIPRDTLVMRVADLGGVTGTYYLNSKYLPNNETNIQKLISSVKNKFAIKRVVLMGASKGGSGALYHGLLGNYDFVAVDPIVTDEYYFEKHNDLHFMKNISDISKEQSFISLLNNKKWMEPTSNKVIITSDRSPQYSYISNIIFEKYKDFFSIFENTDPQIKSHPDVSPKSLLKTTSLVNTCLNEEPIKNKVYHFISDDIYQSKNTDELPLNWKSDLELIVKKSRVTAVQYLDTYRNKANNLSDLYYWHYAINLRATKQYEKCREVLDEGGKLFPDSKILNESNAALYFDLERYWKAYYYYELASKLRRLPEKSFVKFLFSSMIASNVDGIRDICKEYLEINKESSNAIFYYCIFGELINKDQIGIDDCIFRNILTSFFYKNRISVANLEFIFKRLEIEREINFDIDLSVDIPNSGWEYFLKIYKISRNSSFKEIFLNVAFALFKNQKRLTVCNIDKLSDLINKLFPSKKHFLSELNMISLIEVKSIIHILYRVGDISLASSARKQFSRMIEAKGDMENFHACMLARADTEVKEEGSFETYSEAFGKIKDEWFNNIYPCIVKHPKVIAADHKNEIRDKYFDYLKNRRIAIVAPVDTGEQSGDEIDNYDVVIRFNYKGVSKLGHKNIFGSKTNIGYYRFADVPSEFDETLFNVMMELDYVVVPEAAILRYKWLQRFGNKLRGRYEVYHGAVNPFLVGYANAIQRALMDIIRFPFGEIKIFNANAYYDNNITPEYGRKRTDRKNTFCYHEPISNFNYINSLWRNGWVSVDKGLEKVLSLGKDGYIENMHKNYGIDIFNK